MIGKSCSQGGVNKSNRHTGFTLVEVVMGVVILGFVVVSLFTLLTSGFAMVQLNRDNLRATQIMLNRVEGLRLHNWEQLTSSNWIPSTFTETYLDQGSTNANKGTVFTGVMTITNAVQSPSSTYGNSMMRSITVQVFWTNGGLVRSRQLTTYVSQYGIQNYVFREEPQN